MSDVILRPDICVVGAGSAGLTVAAACAAFGVETVLIERGRMGGDCLNVGCVPSKALIAAAARAQSAREASAFGIALGEPRIEFAEVRAHVEAAIAAIAPNDSVARFEGLGVRVVKAEARFGDAQTLEAGGLAIRARRFVLATGSVPRIPDLPGLADIAYLTNESLFDLAERPEHLVILGGGPIGMEMAQAFRRLGSAVTLVETGRVLKREAADLTAIVAARLRREGVVIHENTRAVRARGSPAGVEIDIETAAGPLTVAGSHLLVAIGRTVDAGRLDLARAGIEHGPQGIRVGRDLRTANRRVYAVGDAVDGPRFTHAAGYQAGLVVRALLFRLPVRPRPKILPRVTFTDPPIAAIGLSAAEAREAGHRVLEFLFADLDRAVTERETEGFLRLVVGRRGRLLGAELVGARADEIMNLLSLALARSMSVGDLSAFVSPYPTLGEIAKRAATAYYRPYAERPGIRRLVRLLSRLG